MANMMLYLTPTLSPWRLVLPADGDDKEVKLKVMMTAK